MLIAYQRRGKTWTLILTFFLLIQWIVVIATNLDLNLRHFACDGWV